MAKSKGQNWNVVKGSHADFWRAPSVESFYLVNRWHSLEFKDFLDLGCGLGRYAILFGKNYFIVSCFDISDEAISQTKDWAKSENLNLNYEVGDALNLPFRDNSFDAILSYHVINHKDIAGMKRIVDEIIDAHQVKEFIKKRSDGKVCESWHCHVLIRKPQKQPSPVSQRGLSFLLDAFNCTRPAPGETSCYQCEGCILRTRSIARSIPEPPGCQRASIAYPRPTSRPKCRHTDDRSPLHRV